MADPQDTLDTQPLPQPAVSETESTPPAMTPEVVATAKAKQLSPDEAMKLNQSEYWSMVGISSKEAPAYLAASSDQAMERQLRDMGSWNDSSARWIASHRNAALIKDSLEKWKVYHESIARAQLPDPSGFWAAAGQTLKQSGRRAAYGLTAIPVALGAPIEAALTGGWENTTLFALSDAALAKEQEEGAEMADIAGRHEALGGGRLPLLTGQLLGQLPEMLVGGLGAATLAKMGIRQVLTIEAKAAIAAGRATLTTEMAKKAMLGASAIQAGQEGARVLMNRGMQNVEEGKDAFTSKDVAAAMVTGVVVMATEMLGGLTGEMAYLGGKGAGAGARGFATNVATQAGQETVQEALPSILTDIMDGKELQWDEYGWQALGGLIGGGLFGSIAFIGAMQHASPQTQTMVKKAAPLIQTAAQATKAEAHAAGFMERVQAMAEAPSSKRMTMQELAAGLEATSGKLDQHFNYSDFVKIAEAKAIAPEALMAQLGVKNEAGIVTMSDAVLTAFTTNEKPEIQQLIANHIKATPETPSKTEVVEAFETLAQVGKDMVEPVLPDGTKDDSSELEAVVAAEIAAADKVAGSKRTPTMAKREATINAAMARAAAIEWNAHYAKQGKTDRVTPKQLWDKYRATVTGDTGAGGLEQAVFHGTGNNLQYDRFRYDRVGGPGGEGAQAYGWGLYFTGRKEVADHYKQALQDSEVLVGGRLVADAVNDTPFPEVYYEIEGALREANGDVDAAVAIANKAVDTWSAESADKTRDWNVERWTKASDWLKTVERGSVKITSGKTYTVEIPDDGDLLDWNKDLDQQSEPVKAALAKIDPDILNAIDDSLAERNMGGVMDGGYTGKDLYRLLAKHSDVLPDSDEYNEQKAASDYLRSIGVPGITYMGEYKKTRGEGARNYVIFDDSKIQIKAVEQKGEGAARGTYDWNNAIIRIGKAADASTVHHELMHHWLEVTKAWAADAAAPDAYRQQMADIGAWATDNAASISNAYAKVSGKSVSADDIKAAAADVGNLNLNTDSGKAIHEAMSYAYEEYLSTGKAPTKELQSVFRQIAKYFRSIYGVIRKYVTAAGEPLLDKKVSKIFDRMLVSADMEQQYHLSPETIEKAKLPPQVVDLLDAIYGDRIGQAQSDAYERMRKSLEAQSAAKLAKVTEEVKAELAKIPVFKAQLALAGKKLDAAAVSILIRGTPQDGMDMTMWTQQDGAQPTDVAIEAGYTNGALEMLQELSAAPLYEDAVAQTVESRMDRDADPSTEERIAALADAKEGRLALLAAELRALKAPLQVATTTAKAVQAEEQAAAAMATKEELAKVKAEYRAKIEQIAAKAKMEQADFEAARRIFMEWVGKDANSYAIFQATRRMQYEPMTFAEITAKIPVASKKVSKLAANGDFQSALQAHLEVEVLTQMAKQAKNRDVATVKANADAALARKALEVDAAKDKAQEKKAAIQGAWKRESSRDVATWNAWADQQLARTPVADLRQGQWEARANAAMKRRGKYAADGNVAGIIRETEQIAAAIAMEAAVLRSLKKRGEMLATITDGVSRDGLTKLQSAGHYTVINDRTGEVTSYYTAEEAKIAESNAGKAATTTRSTDLLVIGDMVRKLMSSKTRQEAVNMLNGIVEKRDIGYANISPAFERMILQDRLDPDSWRMEDWATVEAQVKQLHDTADARPSVSAQHVKDNQDGAAAISETEVPPTQSKDRTRVGDFLQWVAASVINLRTHVQKLGSFGEDVILGGATRAETKQKEFQDVIAKLMKDVYTFTRAERKALDEPISMYGVQTSRMQNLARLLMWGTDTGRQRVMADLRARGIAPGDMVMFMSDCMRNVTAKEAAFMNRMWEANDRIWEWDAAAAKSAGIALATKLEPRSFRVMSDTGENIEMRGGYASVPYKDDSDFSQIDLMTPEGLAAVKVGLGWNNERAQTVNGRELDLSLDAQHKSQMSHIRAAAFLPYAEQMNALLTPSSAFYKKAVRHLGQDWVDDLKDHLKFIFNGVPRNGANKVASIVHQGQTQAVFGLNMLTSAKQVGGILVSMGHKDVGVIPALGAAAQVVLSPRQSLRFTAERSMAFATRWELGPDTDFTSPEALIGHQRLYRKWMHLSTAPMRIAQGVADLVTWIAAYNRFKGEHPDMEPDKLAYEARRVADRALMETQGSAMRTEAARVNQTQIGVCATFGGKWMLNNTNWMIRLYRGGDKGAFCKAALSSIVVSSVAMTGISALLQPEDDDEKQRTYRDYAYKVGFDILGQPHYVLRMISDSAYGQWTEGAVRGGGSIISTGGMALKGMTTIFDQWEDDKNSDDWEKIIGGAVQAGAIFPTGVPAVQAKRALDNWAYDNKNWKSGWERFVAGVFGADSTARAKR